MNDWYIKLLHQWILRNNKRERISFVLKYGFTIKYYAFIQRILQLDSSVSIEKQAFILLTKTVTLFIILSFVFFL